MATDDTRSTFSYDGEAESDSFNLHQLEVVVSAHFRTACSLNKLAEGGYHKVYEVVRVLERKSLGIVRVAAPAFPKDKVESEVATLKYLAEHTQIPVPEVYAWNSDASNPVGAEYIIMQKVPGISADKHWDTLSMSVKQRIVAQVAKYLKTMFDIRFDCAGALYLSSPSKSDVYVGPIITTPFYRALDGVVRVPGLCTELSRFRGPFSSTTKYLESFVNAELYTISHHRAIVLSELTEGNEKVASAQLNDGERILRKALELCTIYPGNNSPGGAISTPSKPFSLRLDDFRLSNIMIDEKSGNVTGLIDFEGATISPLWECALIPRWLLDPKDSEASYEGGPAEDRRQLRDVFWNAMDSEEWRALYEHGKPFRRFTERLGLQVGAWIFADSEKWVDERLAWAKLHPGVGLQEE